MSIRPQPGIRVLAATLLLAAACDSGTTPVDTSMDGDTMAMDTMPTNSNLAITDADILSAVVYDSTWTWWEHSDSLLDRTGNSPHGTRIRVRYNPAAATQLDSTGRVVAQPAFPDTSIVVKEVFTNGTSTGILVMYKADGDPNAGHGSWLWFEYTGGTVTQSVGDDDGFCHNCHVTGADHMRMPDSH